MAQIITNRFFDDCEAIFDWNGQPAMRIDYAWAKKVYKALGGDYGTWDEVCKAVGFGESIRKDPTRLAGVRVFVSFYKDVPELSAEHNAYRRADGTINDVIKAFPTPKGGSSVGVAFNIFTHLLFDGQSNELPIIKIDDPYEEDNLFDSDGNVQVNPEATALVRVLEVFSGLDE